MTQQEERLNDVLEQVAQELDIPPHKYKLAMDRFEAIKHHLENGDYPASTPPPSIYIQGSFRYGTVIRPLKDGKDVGFDLDMACEINRQKDDDEPENLKDVVGAEVKSYAQGNGMSRPKDKRRCWTLEYAPDSEVFDFHVDILPCLPDLPMGAKISRENNNQGAAETQYTSTTIAITNRNDDTTPPKHSWQSSNPHGFAKWFKDICLPGYGYIDARRQKTALFEAYQEREGFSFGRADNIPNELLRTPLQRAIQIMKRHRDVRFDGRTDEEHKPIAMIITTLAARLYEGRASELTTIRSALRYIVNLLAEHVVLASDQIATRVLSEDVANMRLIQRVRDKWYIPNPVNPHYPGDPDDKGENFADRWHKDNHAKAKAFFQWVDWLRNDLDNLLNAGEVRDMGHMLKEAFGENLTQSVMRRYGVLPVVLVPKKSRNSDTPKYPKIELPSKPSKPWGSDGR